MDRDLQSNSSSVALGLGESTNIAAVAQSVEQHHGKVEVDGSIPFSGMTKFSLLRLFYFTYYLIITYQKTDFTDCFLFYEKNF